MCNKNINFVYLSQTIFFLFFDNDVNKFLENLTNIVTGKFNYEVKVKKKKYITYVQKVGKSRLTRADKKEIHSRNKTSSSVRAICVIGKLYNRKLMSVIPS